MTTFASLIGLLTGSNKLIWDPSPYRVTKILKEDGSPEEIAIVKVKLFLKDGSIAAEPDGVIDVKELPGTDPKPLFQIVEVSLKLEGSITPVDIQLVSPQGEVDT